MYNPGRDDEMDINAALRRGLEAIPIPEPSSGFDAAVMSGTTPAPTMADRLRSMMTSLRPVLAAAAITTPVALLAISAASVNVPWVPQAPAERHLEARSLPEEQALDRSDLTPASLTRLSDDATGVRTRNPKPAGHGKSA